MYRVSTYLVVAMVLGTTIPGALSQTNGVVVIQDSNGTNPNSLGFTGSVGGVAPGSTVGNAWIIPTGAWSTNYDVYTLTGLQVSNLLTAPTWTFTATFANLSTGTSPTYPDAPDSYGSFAVVIVNGVRIDLGLRSDGAGNQILSLDPFSPPYAPSSGPGPQYTIVGLGTNPVTLSFFYTNATQTGNAYVNGTEVISGFAGNSIIDPNANAVSFGGQGGSFTNVELSYDTTAPTPPPPPPPPSPTITLVLRASDYGSSPDVAPGAWVEVYGTDLAAGIGGWANDFIGDKAPTLVNGVSVNIGTDQGFVAYVSPTQINVQLPSNIPTGGMQQITVTNGTQTSSPYSVMVKPTVPGLLAPASFKIGANQYVVAQHLDGTFVLPVGAIPGATSSPAKPEETIIIFGVGFGDVTPNIPAGEIVTEDNKLSTPITMELGKTHADLGYYGLAPTLVGMYQFNVTVPKIANSDLVPLTFTLGGVAGTQTLFTAVHD
jgi:uncharacterized protein (TIGR03437 family)